MLTLRIDLVYRPQDARRCRRRLVNHVHLKLDLDRRKQVSNGPAH